MDEFVGDGTETNTEKNAKKNTENISRSSSEKTYSYIGNRNSHVFHNPDCDSVSDMKEKNKVYFEDATRLKEMFGGKDISNYRSKLKELPEDWDRIDKLF